MGKLICLAAAVMAAQACSGNCVQVQITKVTDYYALDCPTKDISEQCTVGLRVGTLSPKDNNDKDNIFNSTGEWHLKTSASGGTSPALSGTQLDVIMNGTHYVIDVNNGQLIATNNSC